MDIRARIIAAVSAAAATAACGDSCPHTVIDRHAVVQLDAATACSLAKQAQQGFGGFVLPLDACKTACKDATITVCSMSNDYVTSVMNAFADGGMQCPVAASGVALSCDVTHSEGSYHSGCPISGRRPEGLAAAAASARDALGRFLADAAHLEAAAVLAFERMSAELTAHGAPDRLVRWAERAAREEIAHGHAQTALAARHGASPAAAHAPAFGERSLLAMALENVVEGVVRETYGAAAASWAAEHAVDSDVRAAMQTIAIDERSHAQLSWEVDAWVRGRLDACARAVLDRAKSVAIDELRAEVARDVHPAVARGAGHPPARAALAMLDALEGVWVV